MEINTASRIFHRYAVCLCRVVMRFLYEAPKDVTRNLM